jgi:hypothetical protein
VISFTDPTFTLPMGLFWTSLEPCLCIINANLPMCRNYLIASYPSLFGTTSNNYVNSSRQITGDALGRKRAQNDFEMLGGSEEFSGNLGKARNVISGGVIGKGVVKKGRSGSGSVRRGAREIEKERQWERDMAMDEVSIESQRGLTKNNRIVVGTTVDIEHDRF